MSFGTQGTYEVAEGEIVGKGSTLVTLHKVSETKKAFIVEVRQGKMVLDTLFLPKSVTKYSDGIFEIPEWLAKKLLFRDYVQVIKECAEKRPAWIDDILNAIDRIAFEER